MLGAMLLYAMLGHVHGIGEHGLAILWCNCLLNCRKNKRELTIYILRKQKGWLQIKSFPPMICNMVWQHPCFLFLNELILLTHIGDIPVRRLSPSSRFITEDQSVFICSRINCSPISIQFFTLHYALKQSIKFSSVIDSFETPKNDSSSPVMFCLGLCFLLFSFNAVHLPSVHECISWTTLGNFLFHSCWNLKE